MKNFTGNFLDMGSDISERKKPFYLRKQLSLSGFYLGFVGFVIYSV
ncbi:hypothetical protein CULC22_00618 [Corynebacterium ulcerans BR-AD22]|nr:hypothetical protein CULC22_00618 [Corynebacterium ulcerans BR-AD22]